MRLEPEFMRELVWRNSRGLAFTIQSLNRIQRQGARALYTFIRVSRDTIDKAGSKIEAMTSVSALASLFEAAKGESAIDHAIDQLPDLGLAHEAWLGLEEEFSIPRRLAVEYIHGLRLEAEGFTPKTNEELLRFCYQTGGVLGLVASYIVSAPEGAVQSFVDGGSACRLTSLANNVYKDFSFGRVFVPTEWISQKVTSTFSQGWATEAAKRFSILAAVLYASAREALPLLPFQTRIAISVGLLLHRESRGSLMRKVDRTFDELLRQTATLIWNKIRPADLEPAPTALPPSVRDANFALRNQTYRFARDLEKN